MKNAEFVKNVKKLTSEAIALLEPKGHDYADQKDRLGNFKRISTIFNTLTRQAISPYDVALMFQIAKLDRENNLLLHGHKAKNESLTDSIKDELNYLLLKVNCLKD